MTDNELIQTYTHGDESAFKEIIKRYESQIAATIYGMLGQCPEAEDVGQETFIRFHQSLKNFRGQSTVGTYLTRIAINLSLNELKRRKRRSILFFKNQKNDEEFEIPANDSPDEVNENKELVQQALQNLEPEFRSVIVLRLIDGYSTKETAEILGIPVGTALSRLARGQQKLKKILAPYLGLAQK